MTLHYNEAELIQALNSLAPPCRVAVACACAERLFPSYERFAEVSGRGDSKALRNILEWLWSEIERDAAPDQAVLNETLEICMALIPAPDEEPLFPEQPVAEDCAAVAAYAVRCYQTADVQESAWAARTAYETLDNYVIATEEIDINAPGAESIVMQHKLIQQELARQLRDIHDLAEVNADNRASILHSVRLRAREEAPRLFA